MPQFFANYNATDLFAIAVGVALLIYGRRLYWLALGAVGFFGGIWLAGRLPGLATSGLGLGGSFLIGVLGAFLAVAAQRMAIGLGGFFIGGALAYWSAAWLSVPLGWQPGPWLWLAGLFGAIFGTLFAAVLFDASLLALTALFGALLVAKASHVGPPHESLLFLILLTAGVIVQSGRYRAKHHRLKRHRVKRHRVKRHRARTAGD